MRQIAMPRDVTSLYSLRNLTQLGMRLKLETEVRGSDSIRAVTIRRP
jgi:hypothetical protein